LIRGFGSGLWGLTTVGERVRRKIVDRIEAGLRGVGAQRVRLPSLQYRERWAESGRWDAFEGEMFTLQNRDEQDLCLAPSHEEAVVHLVDGRIRSYDDLPLVVYQVDAKFRDDHARDGLVRAKEFGMADAYSLHTDRRSLHATYRAVRETFASILEDIGLSFAVVEADTGVMDGSNSEEFVAPVSEGSDRLRYCTAAGCRFGVTDEHDAFAELGTTAADSETTSSGGTATDNAETTSSGTCPECGGSLAVSDGIEVGHVFQLGTRYTDAAGLTVDDATGGETTVQMGSYGLGVGRLLQTLVRQHATADGLRFPVTDWGSVAPYRVAVIPVGEGGVADDEGSAVDDEWSTVDDEWSAIDDEPDVATVAAAIHDAVGDDALLYDGDRSVGERFAESALLGTPATVVVGNRYRETGLVDLETRDGETTRHSPAAVVEELDRFAAGE
jgi:prolyl-tRNA synthetase